MQEQEHANITYLKQQQIGQILSQGIAEVYLNQPKFPIEYLAKWLLNYSHTQNLEKQMQQQYDQKQQLIIDYNERVKQEEKKHDDKVKELVKDKQIDMDFYKLLEETEQHNELLINKLPQFLKDRKGFTGVYIAVLDYPEKEIAQDDDEEDAHLDKGQPKLLKYIGWNQTHKFMKGQALQLEEGVTGAVFQEKNGEDDQQQQPEEGEEGEQIQEKKDYVYIQDVVKDNRIKFFTIPKLGSYMAVPLIFQSYLTAIDSFDNGVMINQKYLMEKEEIMKRRQERETEIADMLREREEAGAENEEIQQIQEQFEEEKKQDPVWTDQEEPEYPSIKKEYVVCMDTLGQDKNGINEQDQSYVESLVKTLGKKWQECEDRLLHQDVEQQVQYLEGITANYESILDNFINEEENYIMERQEQLNEFKDKEFELMYETECYRLEKVKLQILDPDISRYIYMLKDFHIIKYPQVFQIALYLIGYTKEEINIPGTNNLNWNYFRTELLDDEKEIIIKDKKAKNEDEVKSDEENNTNNNKFLNIVLNYEHRGPKQDEVPDYAKIMRLTKRKEKLQQAEIDVYNIGLGRLFHWLDLVLKLRRMDIELRQIQKQRQRQERQDKILENEQIAQLKEQELENLRSGMTEEELEAYDMEEWERNFDEQNPLQEIPSEIFDDVDIDLEVEQQQQEEQQQQQQQ